MDDKRMKYIRLCLFTFYLFAVFSCVSAGKGAGLLREESGTVSVRLSEIVNCAAGDDGETVLYTVYEGNNYDIYFKNIVSGESGKFRATSYDEVLGDMSGGMTVFTENSRDVKGDVILLDAKSQKIFGSRFVKEFSPSLSGKKGLFLSRKEEGAFINIFDVDSGVIDTIAVPKAKEAVFGTGGGVFCLGENNNIFIYDSDGIKLYDASVIPKYSIKSDGIGPGIYYISHPFDTDGDGRRDDKDGAFIIYNVNGKERFLFYAEGLNSFDINNGLLVYSTGNILRYSDIRSLKKDYSSVYHHISAMQKIKDPCEIVILAEDAMESYTGADRYLFASNCLMQLESSGMTDVFAVEKERFREMMEGDEKYYKKISLFGSGEKPYAPERENDDLLLWDLLYGIFKNEGPESYMRHYSAHAGRIRSRKYKNRASYHYAAALIENGKSAEGARILEDLVSDSLMPDETVLSSLDLLLRTRGEYAEDSGYSINAMERMLNSSNELIRGGAAGAMIKTLSIYGDTASAIKEGMSIVGGLRETPAKEILYESLLLSFGEDPYVEQGVEFFSGVLEEGYNGRLYQDIALFIKRKGMSLAEKYMKEKDTLKARKMLLTMRNVISGDVNVNRELIKLDYTLGDIIRTAGQYKSRFHSMPEDPVSRYLYGYALSFAGTYYGIKGDADREYSAYMRSLELIKKAIEDEAGNAYYYLTAGWLEERLENMGRGHYLEAALKDYKTGLGLSVEPALKGFFYKNIGNVYFQLGLYEDALENFRLSERSVPPYDSTREKKDYLLKLSEIYYNTEQYETALETDSLLFAIFYDEQNISGMDYIHRHRGLILSLMEEHLKAVKEFEKAYALSSQTIDEEEKIVYFRNIAYNALLGKDDEKAVEYALKVINMTENGGEADGKRGLLNINVDVSIGGTEESSAYKGFSNKMERDLAYSILAKGYQSMGDFEKAIYYYNEKLSHSENKYADMVIYNNLATLYYQSGRQTESVKWLSAAVTTAREQKYKKAYMVNRLSEIFENRQNNPKVMDELDDMAENSASIGDEALLRMFKLLYIDQFMRFSAADMRHAKLESSVAEQQREFLRMQKALSFAAELSRQYDEPGIRRFLLLFRNNITGEDITEGLKQILGKDKFYDYLIHTDLASHYVEAGDRASAMAELQEAERLIKGSSSSDALAFNRLMLENPDHFPSIAADLISEQGYGREIISLLAAYDSLFERVNYLIYKPALSSQLDTVNAGNYFYYMDKGEDGKYGEYLNAMSASTRNMIGAYYITPDLLSDILLSSDVLYYRLDNRYLRLTSDSAALTDNIASDAVFIVDRSGAAFSPSARNFYSLQQFSLFYEQRYIDAVWEDTEMTSIFGIISGSYRARAAFRETVNPFDLEISDSLSVKDVLSKSSNIDGLQLSSETFPRSAEMRTLTNALLYNGVGYFSINGIRMAYRDMSEPEIGKYVDQWISRLSKNGYIYYREGLYDRAFREIKKMVPLLRRKGDDSMLSQYLYQLIKIASDNIHAPGLIEDELRLYLRLKGEDGEGVFYDRMSALYEKNGFYLKAIEYLDLLGSADTERMAGLYEKNGDFDLAIKKLHSVTSDTALLREAIILYKYMRDFNRAETLLSKITDIRLAATVTLTKALLAIETGDYTYATAALAELSKSDDKKTASNASLGMAALEYKKGNYFKSVFFADAAGRSARSGGLLEEFIISSNIKALSLMETGSYDVAGSILDTAVETAEKYNLVTQISTLKINQALVWRKKGDTAESLKILNALEDEYKEKNNKYILKGILRNRGITYYMAGDYIKSKKDFDGLAAFGGLTDEESIDADFYAGLIAGDASMMERALEKARAGGMLKKELMIASKLGITRKDRALLERSLDIISEMTADNENILLRTMLFVEYREVYESLIDIYFSQRDYKKALSRMEMVKRASFYINNPTMDLSAAETAEKKAFYDAKDAVYEAISLAAADPSYADTLKKRVYAYNTAKTDLLLRYQPAGLSLWDDDDFAVDCASDVLAVSYYTVTASGRSYAVYYQDGIYDGAVIDNKDSGISEKIEALLAAITGRDGGGDISSLAEDLYGILFPRGIPDDVKEIVISPHWKINYVPFYVLKTGEGDIIDKYLVKYVSDLGASNDKAGRNSLQGKAILAVGNPDLGAEELELYFAQKEASEVNFLFPGKTRLLKGLSATESEVKKILGKGDFSVIHLACHGSFNRDLPSLSYLMLTPGKGEDGILDVDEIRSLSVSSELVVLSACETGVGVLGEGGEIEALDRAFLSGGSGAVISSFWRISDVATGILFKNFYRKIYEGGDPQTALWESARELKERYPDPVYWGAMKFNAACP